MFKKTFPLKLNIYYYFSIVLRQIHFILEITFVKKILTIFLSIVSLTLMAQVPQGIGYQGVATDANGIELVNQSISIRASVLSGSATGTVEWEETHATTTDTFGLFTLTIGQGTNTTNGLQTSFADISWGTNTHFLKIEMDVNGGTNYAFMGTNQMMSVPYALYAESANINYDSISNFLSGDSTFITNVSSGMGGGGCDYAFPEGLDGDPISHDLVSNSYTVPNGKNLYITHLWAYGGSGYLDVYVDGIPISTGQVGTEVGRLNNSIVVSSGQIVSTNHVFTGVAGFGVSFNGFLVDKIINPITHNLLVSNSYTVPSGKNLYITHLWSYGSAGSLDVYIDGILINSGQLGTDAGSNGYTGRLNNLIIASSGQVVSTSHVFTGATNFGVNFNGYIADENYFAGCGGGGGSSSSNSNSSTGNITVSTFGDTLTMNGQSIIVPGLSYANITPTFGTISDTCGNIYQTLQIGSQTWMAENLRTTKFSNGDDIVQNCSPGTGTGNFISNPHWAWFQCDPIYDLEYGKLYNQYTITDTRNVCPTGWHVPTNSEWETLFNIFGNQALPPNQNSYTSGDELRSSTSGWLNNFYGNNQSYLDFKGAGRIWSTGNSQGLGSVTYLWSSDIHPSQNAGWGYVISIGSTDLVETGSSSQFYYMNSIRCIKD